MLSSALIPVAFAVLAAGPADDLPAWSLQTAETDARFRGVSAVDRDVAWASGTGGTFLRTTDSGKTWAVGKVSGSTDLDFRDLHAFDASTAVLLSIGPGGQSQIHRTEDGGKTWAKRFVNPDPKGFLDALAFWDAQRGLAFGDPVDGKFQVFRTDDGGKSWARNDPADMPPALENEGAFAASGTCLVTSGTRHAWIATGGASVSRVFRSEDGGRSWSASETPVAAGNASSGIFSLLFRDDLHGLATGGDYKEPEKAGATTALTEDGGKTWTLVDPGPPGFRSGLATLHSPSKPSIVAVGPAGSDLSEDGGKTWRSLGPTGFHAVSLAPASPTGWAVGDRGRVGRLVVR